MCHALPRVGGGSGLGWDSGGGNVSIPPTHKGLEIDFYRVSV